MSKDIKKMVRFFTIADWEDEEVFLREQHKKGWKFKKYTLPCFYTFEKCEPDDVIYKLDFANYESGDEENYWQMFRDEGWEYLCVVNDFSYFRKRNIGQESMEIFSDVESRIDMIEKIQKKRLLPLLLLFLCCVIPQTITATSKYQIYGDINSFFTVLWCVIAVIYIWLFVHSGIKFKKLKEKYQK